MQKLGGHERNYGVIVLEQQGERKEIKKVKI
jgi:hypothetical protein